MRYNPSLSQEPRSQSQANPAIPPKITESLLDWLQRTGRLEAREIDSSQGHKVPDELEDILDPVIYSESEDEEGSFMEE